MYRSLGFRTTPASAGSTSRSGGGTSGPRDHPRVGGEYQPAAHRNATEAGPPPRRRGAPRGEEGLALLRRTTPASAGSTAVPPRGIEPRSDPPSAGSTRAPPVIRPTCPDHPRVGGEHVRRMAIDICVIGPPPRPRGAPDALGGRGGVERTTPASAGSTRTGIAGSGPVTDHPRVGGEHGIGASRRRFASGPPPRRRGAHVQRAERLAVERTTPASAGSTWARWPVVTCTPDHPRVGGEHVDTEPGSTPPDGPPPRRRGAHGSDAR